MGVEVETRQGKRSPGVSVITCTNRPHYIGNLFRNYNRQRHVDKELIIIVHGDNIPLRPYRRLAGRLPHVKVYRLPERFSLGACLNDAVRKAKHRYIAKFDDDDYYAPCYLAETIQAFARSRADVVGKRAHYMYLSGSKTLLLRFPHDENKFVRLLPGATLVMKRDVFRKVQFPKRNVGEDVGFCLRSRRAGFKLFSAGKYNFIAIRRKNSSGHTWIISDKKLIAHHRTIPNVTNVKRFIERTPKGARL